MKTKIGIILMGVMLSAIIQTAPAFAAAHHANDRHDYYHKDHFGWPYATVAALCVLYPEKCDQRPAAVAPAPGGATQPAPPAGAPVNIHIMGGVSDYTGQWWNGLPNPSRLKFASAYMDTHKDSNTLSFTGKTSEDFVNALDVYYQDNKNGPVPIDMALDIVTLKLNNFSEFADCLNGYYIMVVSPGSLKPEAVNAKYAECRKLPQPTPPKAK